MLHPGVKGFQAPRKQGNNVNLQNKDIVSIFLNTAQISSIAYMLY